MALKIYNEGTEINLCVVLITLVYILHTALPRCSGTVGKYAKILPPCHIFLVLVLDVERWRESSIEAAEFEAVMILSQSPN